MNSTHYFNGSSGDLLVIRYYYNTFYQRQGFFISVVNPSKKYLCPYGIIGKISS
jgi:hypothetical protein